MYEVISFVCLVFHMNTVGLRGCYADSLVSVSAELPFVVAHHYVVAGNFKLHENLMHVPQASSPSDA